MTRKRHAENELRDVGNIEESVKERSIGHRRVNDCDGWNKMNDKLHRTVFWFIFDFFLLYFHE